MGIFSKCPSTVKSRDPGKHPLDSKLFLEVSENEYDERANVLVKRHLKRACMIIVDHEDKLTPYEFNLLRRRIGVALYKLAGSDMDSLF
jgi:hypothetical protein